MLAYEPIICRASIARYQGQQRQRRHPRWNGYYQHVSLLNMERGGQCYNTVVVAAVSPRMLLVALKTNQLSTGLLYK